MLSKDTSTPHTETMHGSQRNNYEIIDSSQRLCELAQCKVNIDVCESQYEIKASNHHVAIMNRHH